MLGRHYSALGARNIAALYLLPAMKMPACNSDALFFEWKIPRWLIPLEAAVVLFWLGRFAEAQKINEALLIDTDIPNELKDCVKANLECCMARL
jgi:hypothetical protein